MTPEALLHDLLIKEADRQQLPHTDDLPAARVTPSAARTLLEQLEPSEKVPTAGFPEDLGSLMPRRFATVVIAGFPILIGAFDASVDRVAVDEVWTKFDLLVASTRSRLQGNQSCDLHLFFVAPPGSDQSDFWLGIRGEIEHNDLLCRKLVWLPPEDPARWEESATGFLGRTFLAQPWTGGTVGSRELDQLEDTVGRLSAQIGVSAEALQNWVTLLERKDLESPALVQMLVDALASRNQPNAAVS